MNNKKVNMSDFNDDESLFNVSPYERGNYKKSKMIDGDSELLESNFNSSSSTSDLSNQLLENDDIFNMDSVTYKTLLDNSSSENDVTLGKQESPNWVSDKTSILKSVSDTNSNPLSSYSTSNSTVAPDSSENRSAEMSVNENTAINEKIPQVEEKEMSSEKKEY